MLWSGIQKDGRGNIAPCTVIMPMIAMMAKKKTKNNPEYIVECFMDLLEKYICDAKDELIERFNWIAKQSPKSSTFMYENNTMKGYVPEEGIVSALKHGTLAIGQLGLAETLEILVGCDHCSPKGMELAKRIEQLFADKCNEYKNEWHTPKLNNEDIIERMLKKAEAEKGEVLSEKEIEEIKEFVKLNTPVEKLS